MTAPLTAVRSISRTSPVTATALRANTKMELWPLPVSR
ncbi:hypothetical protein ABIB75_002640 [Bradyrhizobium sp. GM2.2]